MVAIGDMVIIMVVALDRTTEFDASLHVVPSKSFVVMHVAAAG